MKIVAILRSREMFGVLKTFLSGHDASHFRSKEEFLRDHGKQAAKSAVNNPAAEPFALIVNAGIAVDEEILSVAGLKMIQQFGIGYENVDIRYASKKGIPVFNVPTAGTYNAVSVGELTLFFILALARNYNGCIDSINHGIANQPMGNSITGKKFGIVGLGGIGAEIIKMLKPFNPEIYGLKHSRPENDFAQKLGLKFAGTVDNDFEYILPLVDYLVLAVPLEKNTENLFNEKSLEIIKPGAFIINVGRAGLISRPALISGLKAGVIKGAGLDVFWEEPVHISDDIFHFNVIATPHIGGATYESIADISRICASNINAMFDGGVLLNCVNMEFMKTREDGDKLH